MAAGGKPCAYCGNPTAACFPKKLPSEVPGAAATLVVCDACSRSYHQCVTYKGPIPAWFGGAAKS